MCVSGCNPLPVLLETSLLCKDWQVIRPSKADIAKMSEELAIQLLANNESRVVYGCKRHSNEASE